MSSWAPTKYKTSNCSACNDALKWRGSMTIWFDPEMTWRAPPTGKRGRQPSFSDTAIQTCLTMKVLFGCSARPRPEVVRIAGSQRPVFLEDPLHQLRIRETKKATAGHMRRLKKPVSCAIAAGSRPQPEAFADQELQGLRGSLSVADASRADPRSLQDRQSAADFLIDNDLSLGTRQPAHADDSVVDDLHKVDELKPHGLRRLPLTLTTKREIRSI